MNPLQSLLVSIESRFRERFLNRNAVVYGGELTDEQTKHRIEYQSEEALTFIKQSHEEIIRAVVEWANMAKPWEKMDMELQLTTKGKFTAKSTRDFIAWQNGYRRALNDLKALLSPKKL